MKKVIATGVLAGCSLWGCAAPIQSELDAEVRRLCHIDGGIKVYETVKLPLEKFDAQGSIRIPAKAFARVDDEYYYESETRYYRKGNPEMWRAEYRIVRARDKKVLGTSVVYVRRGGDMPSPMHDSSFACPPANSQSNLTQAVFVRGM